MALIRTPDEITAEWLGDALGESSVELGSIERIGTGQMSQSHRITFTANGGEPQTIIVKLASDDDTSRATGVGLGAYFREISFYRNLAPQIGPPLAGCRLAEYDETDGWFTLLLDDAAPAVQGDQIRGCTVEEARIALDSLARIQAPVLGDLTWGLADWLNLATPINQELVMGVLPGFLERYGDRITEEQAALCEQFLSQLDAWSADIHPPPGLVHGDYRLDNLLFGPDECTVVDWQTVTWGPALLDASYFVGSGLTIEDRRANEEDLIRGYHEALIANGAKSFDWETCWSEYRRQCFHGLLMVVAPAMLVVRTDRGDEMFMTSLERFAQQAIDLEAVDLLPSAGGSTVAALRPSESDDADRHEPGEDPNWSESWYFDAVSDDAELGVYLRLGRVPNQGVALYTAYICGPDRPTVMLVDAGAELPPIEDERQAISGESYSAEQHCDEPLQRFRASVSGTGAAHTDPGAILRAEPGEPLEIAIDLTWETDGVPYAWRQTTRYEIPCRVRGTVKVGDETIELDCVGQRDHSWGARDWWASDWMWSGLHMADGRRLHAVGVPGMPDFGVGYLQQGDELEEITAVEALEQYGPDSITTSARINARPVGLELDVEPLAFGPILLTAPDGRVSHFVRAMCRVTDADGATGLGWIEWNRNQKDD